MTTQKIKQTEIGEIPEDWEIKTINELCEVTSSKRIFLSDYVKYGIPFFRSKEIILKSSGEKILDPLFITEDKFNEIDKRFGSPKEGDILLTSVGTLGISYMVSNGERFYFKDGNLTWFRNFKDLIYKKYLLYWLKSQDAKNQMSSRAVGSTQQALTIDALKRMSVLFPKGLNEQEKIVKVLSSLDLKIELNNKMNKTLEAIGQAIFKKWFIDFEFPDRNGKPYKSGGGKMIESELGMIPEGWKIYNFVDLVKQLKPGTNYQPDRVSEGIPFVTGKNVQNGFLDLKDVKYVTEEEYKRVHSVWAPEENDLLITRIGTLGNVGLIRKKDLPIVVHYNNIDIKQKEISYQFLYYLLNSEAFQSQYHLKKKHAVQEYITIDDVETIKIFLPSDIDKAKQYEEIFINIFNKFEQNFNQLENLSQIRDALLPKLMSGEIRVPID